MHHVVYQHKTVKAIEYMIRDILIWANLFLPIRSLFDPDALKSMKDVSTDVSVLYYLRDSVMDVIEHSSDPRMLPAQKILERLRRRDIYKFGGTVEVGQNFELNKKAVVDALVQEGLNINEIIVDVVCIHHGMGQNTNPIDGMRFYNKQDLTTCFPAKKYYSNAFIPSAMGTCSLCVYVKNNAIRDKVSDIFNRIKLV